MRIFDAHVHVEKGLDGYNLPVEGRNIIFNTLESYRTYRDKTATPQTAFTLIFDYPSSLPFILDEIKAKRVQAVKIHSRIQKLRESDYPELAGKLKQVPASVPVIIDTFYYGADLDIQPNLKGVIHLLQAFPERKFVIAHCGGHHLLDYFFHLRELTNFYYELSVILHYLQDSSLFGDLKRLVQYTDKSRILFGSDFPGAPAKGQAETLKTILSGLDVKEAEQEMIFHGNASQLFLPR